MRSRINVTEAFLPPKGEYDKILERVWESKWITNRGVLVEELETKLTTFLGVDHLTLMTNGTLPIQIAIKALNLSGEIITTAFSYVATTSSIIWEGCTPVFIDIDPEYLTIDEQKIEGAITEKTSAILATHVFGNPCEVDEIAEIAKRHNLKVIYDAAHCFDVKYKGKSIFSYGDVSTCSFHATKIFHTGEGGCVISKNENDHIDIFNHHNFGHKHHEEFFGLGINAKMTELQAAMGLAVFDHFESIKQERKQIIENYYSLLKEKNVEFLKIRPETDWNYHYFPVFFPNEDILKKTEKIMNEENIFPRRYFYPTLTDLPYVGQYDLNKLLDF